MGYYDYLCRQLQPLRLYDLEEGAGAQELKTAGAALDSLAQTLETIERESCPLTAENDGLLALESLLPYAPMSGTTQERRAAIAALLRIDGRSFTLSGLRSTLSSCGITATVDESDTPYTVEVSFPDTMGEPENFALLRARIEQILPCHLDVRYPFRYLRWVELERSVSSWADLEATMPDWYALEGFCAE